MLRMQIDGIIKPGKFFPGFGDVLCYNLNPNVTTALLLAVFNWAVGMIRP